MKLLKGLVVLLAIATVVAVGLSIAFPNLLASRTVQGIISSPAESLQKLADKGTSAAKEALGEAAGKAQSEALNKLVDQSGLKEAAVQELHAHAGDIAAATGMDESMIDYAIDSMNIPSWQATTLPDNVTEQNSVPFSYGGTDATITTYDDTGYMTVEAYGQSVTFAVPEAAQSYVPYLGYIG